eukprot:310247-Amphidinium_carterae.1
MSKLCARVSEPDLKRGHKFLGRYVKIEPGGLRITQTVKVTIPEISQSRKKERASALNPDEISSFRSMVGALLWNGRCVSPQLLLDVSRFAQLVTKATIEDYVSLIALARKWDGWIGEIFIPSSIGQCLASKCLSIYVMSDASFADQPGLRSQHGSVIAIGPPDLPDAFAKHELERFAVMGWLCATIKRVVRSTLAAECYAHSEGLEAGMLLRCLLVEALTVRDSTSGDGVTSRDKRALIALMAVRGLYATPGECLQAHWVPTTHMLADRLTKTKWRGANYCSGVVRTTAVAWCSELLQWRGAANYCSGVARQLPQLLSCSAFLAMAIV